MNNYNFLDQNYSFNPLVVKNELTHIQKVKKVAELFFNCPYHDREDITAFTNYIRSSPENLGENPYPLFHTFADGVYSREIHLPAGHIVVGKIHRHESMVYVLKGKLLVADEFGINMVTGPTKFISKPCVQRIAYVLEDTTWIDIHHTDKKTVEEAENELFFNTHEELMLTRNKGDIACLQQ